MKKVEFEAWIARDGKKAAGQTFLYCEKPEYNDEEEDWDCEGDEWLYLPKGRFLKLGEGPIKVKVTIEEVRHE